MRVSSTLLVVLDIEDPVGIKAIEICEIPVCRGMFAISLL